MTRRKSGFALWFVLLAAGAASGVWWVVRGGNPLARLTRSASRESRFVEPRLSGGFPWAPLARGKRGASETRDLEIRAAAIALLRDADPASADSQHAAGVAALIAEGPDAAIARLAPLAESGRSAALWNDLGVACYQSFVASGAPERLKDALAATDQALLFDPALPEALFNRAVFLERFHLRDAAADAWRDFLAHAASDGWQQEALQRAHDLTAPQRDVAQELESRLDALARGDGAAVRALLAVDAGELRTFAETEGMARWGEAWLRRDPSAAGSIERAMKTISSELAAFRGEALLQDTVAAIARADPPRRDALARAHIAFREGRRLFDRRELSDAEKAFEEAKKNFEAGGSPFALEARRNAAVMRFWQGRQAEAEAEYREVLREVPPRYMALEGNVQWQLATCAIARAETGSSIALLGHAVEVFTHLHETDNAAYLHDIISQVYDGARDHDRAQQHRELALRDLGRTSNFRLAHAVNGMVYDALQHHDWRAARSFLNIQLAVNARVKDPEIAVTALLRRARLHAHLGNAADAATDLRSASAVVRSVSDQALRSKLQVDLDAATALVSDDPRTAIPLLTEVLHFHEQRGWRRLMPELYLRRGRMHLAQGDHGRAAADFEAGIALLEQHRAAIPKGEGRWGILDAADELFDEAITEALRSGGAKPAFAYAERKRARSLADALLTGLEAFDAARVPADTLLVEYASLPDRLLVFAVDASGIDVHPVAVPRDELQALATRYDGALRTGDDVARRGVESRLYDALIDPVSSAIASHRQIAFVTDAATSGIAFAALPSRRGGRMLVEDVAISVAPSARLYLAARRRGVQRRSNVLIVDSPVNSALERLESTSEEAEALQSTYPQTRRLTGRAATREAFVSQSRTAEVIHFAGHGVSSNDAAALILSSTANDAGVLDAAAISRLTLRDTDVVVLAACDTARGPVRSAEGVLSVTHAFLQAGAGSVIATLWPLDDRAAADFFPRLHRHLARGVSASEALRLAQLESIRSSPKDGAALWAGVQAIGY